MPGPLALFPFTRPVSLGVDVHHARIVTLPNGLQFVYAFAHREYEDEDVRKNGHYGILLTGRVFPLRGAYDNELTDNEEVVKRMHEAMGNALQVFRVSAQHWGNIAARKLAWAVQDAARAARRA